MTTRLSVNQVSTKAEPVIAALGEDIRPAVAKLEKIFHDYDVGDATGCVYCAALKTDGSVR